MWMPSDDEIKQAVYTAGGFLLGAFFGLLRHIQEFAQATPPPFIWWVAAIRGATAGAVGAIATWLAMEWHLYQGHPYLTGVFIALSGWGGVEFLNAASTAVQEAISDYLRRRLSAPRNTNADGEANKPG